VQEPLACAPAAMAVKSFSSMPARSALVCWCACSVSKTSIGEGGWGVIGEFYTFRRKAAHAGVSG